MENKDILQNRKVIPADKPVSDGDLSEMLLLLSTCRSDKRNCFECPMPIIEIPVGRKNVACVEKELLMELAGERIKELKERLEGKIFEDSPKKEMDGKISEWPRKYFQNEKSICEEFESRK